MKAIISIISVVVFFSFSYQAESRQDFLQAWKERYPNSASSDRGCQLCHQQTNGGDGWNSYGISVRFLFLEAFQGFDIDSAFEFTEQENSDRDDMGLTNLQEINRGLDPGWIRGRLNPIYFKNGDLLEKQAPPFQDVDAGISDNEAFCFAIKTSEERVALICL